MHVRLIYISVLFWCMSVVLDFYLIFMGYLKISDNLVAFLQLLCILIFGISLLLAGKNNYVQSFDDGEYNGIILTPFFKKLDKIMFSFLILSSLVIVFSIVIKELFLINEKHYYFNFWMGFSTISILIFNQLHRWKSRIE